MGRRSFNEAFNNVACFDGAEGAEIVKFFFYINTHGTSRINCAFLLTVVDRA